MIEAMASDYIRTARAKGLSRARIIFKHALRNAAIPVVAIAESVDAIPLTMILGSGCYVTNDLTTGIHAACWRLMGDV